MGISSRKSSCCSFSKICQQSVDVVLDVDAVDGALAQSAVPSFALTVRVIHRELGLPITEETVSQTSPLIVHHLGE
eukprot:2024-Eustigmatos_ZCMA.PRE.1